MTTIETTSRQALTWQAPAAAPSPVQILPPEEPAQEVDFRVPVNCRESRRYMDRVVVAGRGAAPAELMFISSSVLEEETQEESQGMFYSGFKSKPAYLKGPHGMALKELCTSVGISVDTEVYYTALCKWLLPRGINLNPKIKDGTPGFDCLDRELREVKPKIVVTFAKAALEFMLPVKLKFQDVIGMMLWSEKYQCQVMPMSHQFYVAAKPEWLERFRMDMAQVKRALDESRGVVVDKVPLHYRTVSNKAELLELVRELMLYNLYSIDCEWHGSNHVDGQLRSLQICWKAGHAAYIRFMDDKLNYAFDCSYKEAGAVLAEAWNRTEVKLVGHHISADLPWTSEVLGLDWYGKVRLDTEFAYQCCNEHGDLGLERMSLRYTDLGRYEMELEFWKKANKTDADDGYGRIPDMILIPYSMKDVDTPMRALPYIERDLHQQGMLDYYRSIVNPFIADVFTQFAIAGLPMSLTMLDEMRDLYTFAYGIIEKEFQHSMYEEGWQLLGRRVLEALPNIAGLQDEELRKLVTSRAAPHLAAKFRRVFERAMADGINPVPLLRDEVVKELVAGGIVIPEEKGALVCGLDAVVDHVAHAVNFNIRSGPDLRRWLYEVKQYTPVKSTANKNKGMPSMDWTKVLAMKSAERRAEFTPAVDKQSLQILAQSHDDKVIKEMLELNAVGNIRKAFLKEPDVDPDTGEIIEERGLAAWVAKDGFVHGQMSMTETARTRSWKPNSLNWPSYVQDRIKSGIARALKKAKAEGTLPARFEMYVPVPDPKNPGKEKPFQDVPALRSCVQAAPGWILVESDYKTAEVRGLAFISGDANLIRIMTEPDPQFGLAKIPGQEKTAVVRLNYAPECGIPAENQRQDLIMNVWEEGKHIYEVKPEELVRDKSGNLVHPDNDLHWSLAEMFQCKPRELMINKKDRGAGKVGNFCLGEGELVLTRRGPVAIQDVMPCDKLWDGIEWVNHEGVICTGIRTTHLYQGLRATDNHEVWTVERGKVSFWEARSQRLGLVRSAVAGVACSCAWVDDISRNGAKAGQGVLYGDDRVRLLLDASGEGVAQPGERDVLQMSVPGCYEVACSFSEHAARGSAVSGCKVPSNAAKVREGHPRVESQVQGSWYQGPVRFAGGFHPMGTNRMAGGGFQGQGFRPQREQRPLRTLQLEARESCDKLTEPGVHGGGQHRHSSGAENEIPGNRVHRSDSSRAAALRQERDPDSGASCEKDSSGRTSKVYDILNVGPRHRFTCSGVLVSNSSAYGATPATLERKIESDTGSKPEEGAGQRILDALSRRQPVATEFLKKLEDAPENPGYLRAASGKVRHFVLPMEVAGLSPKLKRSLISAQGREGRNFFMQESVAATAARAAIWLLDFGRRAGLKGRAITVLYDSVLTHCPMHERFIWSKAHDVCMYLANGWDYHGRILRYPIDTEFNVGWSLRPAKHKEFAKLAPLIDSPHYQGTPENLRPIEQWLDQVIQHFEKHERASLTFSGLR